MRSIEAGRARLWRVSWAAAGLAALPLAVGAIGSAPAARAEGAAPAAAGAPSASVKQMIDEQLAEIPSGEEGVDRIMGELTEKLTLTPQQQKEVRPTVQQTVASMEQSRDRYKAGELTPMALAMQIQMASQKAAVLIEPVLDEEQQVKYQAMRQEQRRQMMQAVQKSQQMIQGTSAAK